jgi:predicted RND superfamily exporter protein
MVLRTLVPVNYDLNSYLPADAPSTLGLEKMEDTFGNDVPNMRVMVEGLNIPRALELKTKISRIKGVAKVTWLDDATDILVPTEMMDSGTIETYYRDESALFLLTIENHELVKTVNEIRELLNNELDGGFAMDGTAVFTEAATNNTVLEVAKVTLGAIIFVFLVLLLTTTSWFEPVIVMIGLLVSVVINAGTNIVFGEISFVTNAAGSILQLAVSLDYSVFLLHRYNDIRDKYKELKLSCFNHKISSKAPYEKTISKALSSSINLRAMILALNKTTTSILSSGLTTVIGFFALCLMRFRIGPDLGFALSKGVVISLISVFVFLPSLILSSSKLIDKTRHKALLPSFDRFGKIVLKLMLPTMIIALTIALPSYLASINNDYYYGASHIFGAGTLVGQDRNAIEQKFGKSNIYAIMVPSGDIVKERELSEALHKIPEVTSIISYADNVDAMIPTEFIGSDDLTDLMTEGIARLIITVKSDYEGEQSFAVANKIREIADYFYPNESFIAGETLSTLDLKDTVTADMKKVNTVAIAAVFIVLIFATKTILLPIILVFCIEMAIWINLAIPYFRGSPIFYVAYLIISSIQLGATVDYAILLTDRYTEMRKNMSKKESVVKTVSNVTISILTSGLALLVVGMLLGIFSTHGLLSQLGYFIGIGALCSMVIVIFVLPAMLSLFDRLIRKSQEREVPLKK